MVREYILVKGWGKYCSSVCKDIGIKTHGETVGGMNSPEYNAWESMRKRCANPRDSHYPDYGARGITVCDRWLNSFDNFLADVGRRPSPKHSVDRIDNDGNYEPGNVRWATAIEQSRNQRSNRLLSFDGSTHCISEWAEMAGLGVTTLLWRLKKGWTVERALTTAARRCTRH